MAVMGEAQALRIRDAGMTFGETTVLSGVSLDVAPGEVHALAGHNGSGKSTLVKILAGRYVPHPETSVHAGDASLEFGRPESSMALGLRFVHQNLALVPDLSVTENLALGPGFGAGGLGRIAWPKEHRRARQELASLGYEVDPRAPVRDLSASTRSAVAIARALSDRAATAARILVLDEVTATMPLAEVQRLLALVEGLKQRGVGILMISHHLEELETVADRATILRDGHLVATVDRADVTVDNLTRLIMGETRARARTDMLDRLTARTSDPQVPGAGLAVQGLTGARIDGISFMVRRGEIVGFSGVTGSGREELAELLYGALPRGGRVTVDGHELPPHRPDRALRAGLALVPADRARHAVLPAMSVRENLTISRLSDVTRRGGWIRADREREQVRAWIDTLSITGAQDVADVVELSGGNQQKVMLARAIRLQPKVLVLDEPTQGVDVGAIADIYALIRAIAPQAAIVVCSSDLDELARLCTSVHVLRRGRLIGHLEGDEVTETNIARLELSAEPSPETAHASHRAPDEDLA